jgi:hypothetical protein
VAKSKGASKMGYALLVADCIISSLGIKPAKGGRPPRDRRLNAAMRPVLNLLFINRSFNDLI